MLIMGNREIIDSMAPGSVKVMDAVLKLIDAYDLYGSVAYPKKHTQDDISDIYLLPAATRGVFVNIALQVGADCGWCVVLLPHGDAAVEQWSVNRLAWWRCCANAVHAPANYTHIYTHLLIKLRMLPPALLSCRSPLASP